MGAIFSLRWRWFQRECRGSQDRPHFCLSVPAAVTAVAVAAAAAGRSFPANRSAADVAGVHFANARIQYLASFRFRLCA